MDTILARASSLGLTTTPGGAVDAAAVELTTLYTLQLLAETFDFDTLTVIEPDLFVTAEGHSKYPLPSDFGRFLTPNDDNESGLFLNDGTRESPLRYRDPWTFQAQRATTNGTPGYFTVVAGPAVLLDPPPDTNDDAQYTATGVYITDVSMVSLDVVFPVFQGACLIDMVLGTLAMDNNHPQGQLYAAAGERARQRLVNANARQRQKFQSKAGRFGQVSRPAFSLR